MFSIFANWTIALVVFAILVIADVVTTILALKRGGYEANPLIAFLMETFGDNGWIILKLLASIVGAVLCYHGGLLWGVWLIAALYAYIVWRNHQAAR